MSGEQNGQRKIIKREEEKGDGNGSEKRVVGEGNKDNIG